MREPDEREARRATRCCFRISIDQLGIPVSEIATKLIGRARKLRREGALDAAVKVYHEVLEDKPQDFDALHELGAICLSQGCLEESLHFLDAALHVKPGHFDALLARANTLAAMKRYAEALSGFDEALKIQPDSAQAHNNRGGALGELHRSVEALSSFEKAIELKPDYADARRNRGNALRALGRHEEALLNEAAGLCTTKRYSEALACLDRALATRPDMVEAHARRGEVLANLHRYEDALKSFDRVLALRPYSAEPYCHRAASLFELRRYAEALVSADKALTIRRDFCDGHVKRAQALLQLQRPADALESFNQALAIKSDGLEALVGRGFALVKLCRWRDALACFQMALLLYPESVNAQANYGLTLLTLGDLSAGWEGLEWRWKHPNSRNALRRFPQPRWLGQVPVAGKTLFVYHEQGLGDTLQMVRYVPLLAKQGAHVIVQVQTPLVPLLQGQLDTAQIIGPKDPIPPFDLHSPLMSLPLAFDTTIGTIPAETPYLSAPRERIAAWSDRLENARMPRIGIAWSGNPKHGNDRNRSIDLNKLLPLLSLGIEVVSLQKDVREADREVLKANPEVRDFGNDLKDFADTAALVSLLDLVVTVDTAPAHLTGALGKPVWVLLPFSQDWRWLLDREDSPWYPTARLFRQPAIGDWDSVIRQVVEALRDRFGLGDALEERVAEAEGRL